MEKTAMCVFINLLFSVFVSNILNNVDVFKVGVLNVNGARDQKTRTLIYETMKIKKIYVMFFTRNAQ